MGTKCNNGMKIFENVENYLSIIYHKYHKTILLINLGLFFIPITKMLAQF